MDTWYCNPNFKGIKPMPSGMWSADINELAAQIQTWREGKGFHTPDGMNTENDRDMMLAKLMLVVTEVSEAAEAVRHTDEDNFKEEIADTFIRLFDISSAMGFDVHKIISEKMDINAKHPHKHGKTTSV
jgi:NTP pyrophosphatase (non-canonical NTP hydrolase)